jgi:hypothetical protein
VFAGVIAGIMVYSFIYGMEGAVHPIPSGSELISGTTSASTGMSRSFSSIVRLDLAGARVFNPYGIRIFLFFLIQLFLRMFFFILSATDKPGRQRNLIFTDIVLSVILFVVLFMPFIIELISQFSNS